MASYEHHVQSKIYVETLYGGAHVGMLHRVQRARVPRHAKPQFAEGMPSEPPDGQRHMFSAGEQNYEQLHQGGRTGSPGAGGRHDHMEDNRAE